MSATTTKTNTAAASKGRSAGKGRKVTSATKVTTAGPQGGSPKAVRGVTGSALATAAATATTYAELAKALDRNVNDQAFARAVHFHCQGARPLSAAAIGTEKRDMLLAGVASSEWTRPRTQEGRLFNQPKPKPEPKPKADETDETDD